MSELHISEGPYGGDAYTRAYSSGWADGERWVLDNWWDYAIRRTRVGRWAFRTPVLRKLVLKFVAWRDGWGKL